MTGRLDTFVTRPLFIDMNTPLHQKHKGIKVLNIISIPTRVSLYRLCYRLHTLFTDRFQIQLHTAFTTTQQHISKRKTCCFP